jgi:hypothetical protein
VHPRRCENKVQFQRAAKRFEGIIGTRRAQYFLQCDDVSIEFADHEPRACRVRSTTAIHPGPAVNVIRCNRRFLAKPRTRVRTFRGENRKRRQLALALRQSFGAATSERLGEPAFLPRLARRLFLRGCSFSSNRQTYSPDFGTNPASIDTTSLQLGPLLIGESKRFPITILIGLLLHIGGSQNIESSQNQTAESPPR